MEAAWGSVLLHSEPEGGQRVHLQPPARGRAEGAVVGKARRKVKSLSRVRLCATPGIVACEAPPYTGFSRQE